MSRCLSLRVRESRRSVLVVPTARVQHLAGLSYSRHTDQGLKKHQPRSLSKPKERWQQGYVVIATRLQGQALRIPSELDQRGDLPADEDLDWQSIYGF